MTLEIENLKKRIDEMHKALEQSMANHNFLLGQYNEAQNILIMLSKEPETKQEQSEIIATEEC